MLGFGFGRGNRGFFCRGFGFGRGRGFGRGFGLGRLLGFCRFRSYNMDLTNEERELLKQRLKEEIALLEERKKLIEEELQKLG